MTTQAIKKNYKFVACWGYDQTQYSVYNTVEVKGSFVIVEGMNSWSHLSEKDLCAGSQVKIYKRHDWNDLTVDEKQDFASRGFDWNSYQYHFNKEAKDKAEVRTIKKVSRIDGQSWTYVWELDNGDIVRSDECYDKRIGIVIVRGMKRCKINTKYGNPSIKIDDCITASLDSKYAKRKEYIEAQNEYTIQNGR